MAGRFDKLHYENGYDADGNHKEAFLKNWPADLHLIGKKILFASIPFIGQFS